MHVQLLVSESGRLEKTGRERQRSEEAGECSEVVPWAAHVGDRWWLTRGDDFDNDHHDAGYWQPQAATEKTPPPRRAGYF